MAARKCNPSDAYRAGMADLRAAAARHGTTNLSPSIAQREEWRHAWGDYMKGWNAEKKAKNPAKFDRCVKAVKAKGGVANAYAVCNAKGKKRGNPAAGADAAYEDFHGAPPTETIIVKEEIHFHRHLSAAGELERLVIQPVDSALPPVTLKKFGGTTLAFNEKMNQLFLKGGNQSVPLKLFGIDSPHEVETLGRIRDVDYFTTKDHLGKDGGTATYVHRFRTTNENGRHVTIKIARYPDAIYYVRDKRIVFSGGSYTILPEGIDK
jgi:hypothetical protein